MLVLESKAMPKQSPQLATQVGNGDAAAPPAPTLEHEKQRKLNTEGWLLVCCNFESSTLIVLLF